MPIITSLLEDDLYKYSMQQVVLHNFAGAMVEYKFKCRTPGINLLPYIDEIREEIKQWCNLWYTDEELDYLSTIRFLKPDYIEFLRNFKPNYEYISIFNGAEFGGKEELCIYVKGPWLYTIRFEIPVLAIVNEVYFKHLSNSKKADIHTKLDEKINLVKNKGSNSFRFMDFGTRRRFSKSVQNEVVKTLKKELPGNFTGTSNVELAMKHNLVARGTMAHEMIMGMQSMVRISESQKYAFDIWSREYRGDLGIALSDTLGMDAFFKDFDLYFSKLFDGARQDSGNPFVWADKLIKHYEKMGIDPRTKIAVFSDGLDFHKAIALHDAYKDRIMTSFGIGTNLTNDCGFEPIQIVMKLTKCNGQDVCKISDSEGKQMSDNVDYINYVKSVFNISN